MTFFLYYVLPFICVLGILIFFHELGHFLTAKFFKVKVLKFSLGFGPKLAGRKIGDTEYLISAFPLGGYVKMLGENEEEGADPLPPEDEARAFGNQHVLKRLAIVGAGPLFNLFLAIFIFCIFFMIAGDHVMTPEIGQVRDDSPAQRAGLQKGDIVVGIDGKDVKTWPEIKSVVAVADGRPVEITVKRDLELKTFSVVPEVSSVKNIFGEDVKTTLIGIVAAGKFIQVELSPSAAIAAGFGKTWEILELTFMTIVKLFQRVVPIKTLGGPILIGQLTGQLAQESIFYLFPFMAMISINLCVLNLLPVPILDGGLIVFLLLELFTGKPLSIRKRELAQKVGLFILVTLMMVVIYNDVTRLLE
ncbi:MAG: RIP metalloprotease RseP [Deltaproteobacteria bacterium]|nr:RIP metalloprotease RseP [Deltaproteobacteria bacterium]